MKLKCIKLLSHVAFLMTKFSQPMVFAAPGFRYCIRISTCSCNSQCTDAQSISVGRYHIFTSGIRYYKLRTVFGIPRYLIKQVDEPLSSVNG